MNEEQVSNTIDVVVTLSHADDGHGWPPIEEESVRVRPMSSGGYYVVVTPPLFAQGLAVGDVVEVRRSARDGRDYLQSVHAESDRTCLRLVVFGRTTDEAMELVLSNLEDAGCVIWQSTVVGTWILDFPDSADRESIAATLSDCVDGYKFDLDMGVCTPHTTPLIEAVYDSRNARTAPEQDRN